MASIFGILASNYVNAGTATYSSGKYVPVDADDYQGKWSGKYGNNKSFSVQISNVQGFRATVALRDDSGVKYGQVLIKDGTFRIGDSKFVLQGNGKALIATAITDPVTGSITLQQGYASRN